MGTKYGTTFSVTDRQSDGTVPRVLAMKSFPLAPLVLALLEPKHTAVSVWDPVVLPEPTHCSVAYAAEPDAAWTEQAMGA